MALAACAPDGEHTGLPTTPDDSATPRDTATPDDEDEDECEPGSDLPECRIAFEEVAQQVGIDIWGPSWGASWADFDEDGDPDLYLGNHARVPSLLRNDGGTFVDVTADLIPREVRDDSHNVQFVDFDNDGDLDLFEAVGRGFTEVPHNFWVNEGGQFVAGASEHGIDQPGARGRGPLFVDVDGDGWLDVILNNERRPDLAWEPELYMSDAGVFSPAPAEIGFEVPRPGIAPELVDLDQDGNPEILLRNWRSPARVFEVEDGLLHRRESYETDIRIDHTSSQAFVDFDGDGLVDVFALRGTEFYSEARQVDDHTVAVNLRPRTSGLGARFRATDTVTMAYKGVKPDKVFVGADAQPIAWITELELDPAETRFHGTHPVQGGVDEGLFVGFDPDTGVWTLMASHPNQSWPRILLTSEGVFSDVEPVDHPEYEVRDAVFLFQRDGGWVDEIEQTGIQTDEYDLGMAVADFDNDMDQDIYVVRRSAASNRPNVLYLNNGDGTFERVEAGVGGSIYGKGDKAIVADYDGDGWLDLLVTNGHYESPVGEGPVELFRNLGNGNHWLQVDLVGTASNRDAIGATVIVEAGGVTQRQLNTGGTHGGVQNHDLLHFGLREHELVDRITILWPSGVEQVLTDIPARQRLQVVEPG